MATRWEIINKGDPTYFETTLSLKLITIFPPIGQSRSCRQVILPVRSSCWSELPPLKGEQFCYQPKLVKYASIKHINTLMLHGESHVYAVINAWCEISSRQPMSSQDRMHTSGCAHHHDVICIYAQAALALGLPKTYLRVPNNWGSRAYSAW